MKSRILLIIAALPAALGMLLLAMPGGGLVRLLLVAYAVIFISLALGYILALGLRRVLWGVGQRLAFSYFLIGVLPIPLAALLALVAAYVSAGFLLGHLYRDALHSVATEMRFEATTQLSQLRRGGRRSHRVPIPVSFAYYRGGTKIAGDRRAPRQFQDWWLLETVESAAPSPIGVPFVALRDGSPTIMAAIQEGGLGILAFFDGDLELELSERSGVWIKLTRADDPEQSGGYELTFKDRRYSLRLPRIDWQDPDLRKFFHNGIEEPPFLDRPSLVWAEITRPFLELETSAPAADYVAAGLTGSPRTILFHLVSRSAEIDTFGYLVFYAVAFLLFDIWVIAVIMAFAVVAGMTRAVNRLYAATREVQKGNFSTRIVVERRDQVGELQRSFNQMTENLEQLVASATQKELLEKELEIARELQRSLLPGEVKAHRESLSFATHFAPSAAIGGDYYDVLPLACDEDDPRLAVVVADVSGHGLSAGLRMAMVKSALQLLCEEENDPEAILGRLHRLQRTNRGFVTATLALLNPKNGDLVITNAGHSPTYLWRVGKIEEIVLPSSPLGTLSGKLGQVTRQLEPGDAVVFLSDGLVEAMNEWQEPFGFDGVIASLEGLVDDTTADDHAGALRDRLLADLDRHTGGAPPDDDRTVVVMVYRGARSVVEAGTRDEEGRPAA